MSDPCCSHGYNTTATNGNKSRREGRGECPHVPPYKEGKGEGAWSTLPWKSFMYSRRTSEIGEVTLEWKQR